MWPLSAVPRNSYARHSRNRKLYREYIKKEDNVSFPASMEYLTPS